MICITHNDLDGIAAGAVVKKKYPNCRVVPVGYGAKMREAFKQIKPTEQVIICDLSPAIEDFNILFNVLERRGSDKGGHYSITWIDHHRTSLATFKKFAIPLLGVHLAVDPDLTSIAPKNDVGYHSYLGNLSACEIAWMAFFPELILPDALLLIGDRDAWRWKQGLKTAWFHWGIQAYNYLPEGSIWDYLLRPDTDSQERWLRAIINKGEIIEDFAERFWENFRNKNAFEMAWTIPTGRYHCQVMNIHGIGHEFLFGDGLDKFDICIAYNFNGLNYTVSMYSKRHDVSKIASLFNGGGHKNAAGFTVADPNALSWLDNFEKKENENK